MISTKFDRALRMVQTYRARCGEDGGDPRTAELSEVIGNCVRWMSVSRRGREQGRDARVPREVLRHTLGYVYEPSYTSATDDLVDGRPTS